MSNTVGTLGTEPGGLSVAVSPDGAVVAVGHTDGRVRLWDTATLRRRGPTLEHHNGEAVVSLAFSPDGRLLASGSLSSIGIRIWDVASGDLARTLPGAGAVAWLPGTTTVLATRLDAEDLPEFQIGSWDAATGRRTGSIPSGRAIGVGLGVSPDGRYVALTNLESPVRVFRIADGRPMATLPPAARMAFAPDGSLITATDTNWRRRWAVPSGRLLSEISRPAQLGPPHAITTTPDGILLTGGVEHDEVLAYNAPSTGSATPTACSTWRSTPPASNWPRRRGTAWSGSGTCAGAACCARCARVPSRQAWPMARTARSS
jgi:WD40 repeat protein